MQTNPLEALVQNVPSLPLQAQYFFDVVQGEAEGGEKFTRVVVSFATPQGVNKFWFDAASMNRFAATAFEIAKEARKAEKEQGTGLIVAGAMPGDDRGQATADRAAKQIIDQLGPHKKVR